MDVYPNNSSNVYFNCNMMSNRQIWGNPVFRFDMTHGLFFFSTSAIFDPPITRWCPSALANLRTSSLGESTMVYGRYIYTIYIDLTSHYQLCLSMSIYTVYLYTNTPATIPPSRTPALCFGGPGSLPTRVHTQ